MFIERGKYISFSVFLYLVTELKICSNLTSFTDMVQLMFLVILLKFHDADFFLYLALVHLHYIVLLLISLLCTFPDWVCVTLWNTLLRNKLNGEFQRSMIACYALFFFKRYGLLIATDLKVGANLLNYGRYFHSLVRGSHDSVTPACGGSGYGMLGFDRGLICSHGDYKVVLCFMF